MRNEIEFQNQVIQSVNTAYRTLMGKVYLWMTLALAVTGLTSLYVASSPGLVQSIFASRGTFWLLVIAELALVFILSARIMKMSFSTAGIMFALYSVLNGVTMSFIFIAYTSTSIATAFFVTAGMFAAMSFIGFVTKKDLSSFGSFFTMALIGLIIASVVNIFLNSSVMYWIITYVGVLLFVGLTAYDTQKIKQMLIEYGDEVNDSTQKLALIGSLSLYLDFINLFLYILRLFGNNKE
jgi:FtsH-binding integral membrane protein